MPQPQPQPLAMPTRYCGLQLSCHGGRCCGMKHIYGFNAPSCSVPPIPADVVAPSCNDHAFPGENFYTGEAPNETYLERLDRFLVFCDHNRPHGMIEVSLIHSQKLQWDQLLKDRGFKEVAKAKNSNSGNTVFLYIRCT